MKPGGKEGEKANIKEASEGKGRGKKKKKKKKKTAPVTCVSLGESRQKETALKK